MNSLVEFVILDKVVILAIALWAGHLVHRHGLTFAFLHAPHSASDGNSSLASQDSSHFMNPGVLLRLSFYPMKYFYAPFISAAWTK
jgi:hypothetical protein